MLECLIIGDSIGVGIHQYRQECVLQAQVGINTRNWLYNEYPLLKAKKVIISLGSNENWFYPVNIALKALQLNQQVANLDTVRKRYVGSQVYWVLPENNPTLKYRIKHLASGYGDITLEIMNLSKDRVHPTGTEYKRLSTQF